LPEALLAHQEMQLASHVGQFAGIGLPLAKILLKNIAKNAPDFDGLLQTLAKHIENEKERAAFLQFELKQ